MNQYTGKERVVAALKRKFADRVPLTLLFGAYCARLAGFSIREFQQEKGKNITSHLKAYETFPLDTMTVSMDLLLEAEAAGAKLEFPENSVSHIRNRPITEKSDLAKLKIPDPQKDGRLPLYLEICQDLAGQIKDSSLGGSVSGPWTLATNLRGAQELIFDAMEDAEFVHKLMRFTTDTVKIFGLAVREAGVGVGLGEPSASCSLISPKIYKEFVKPYHQEIVNFFKERKTFLTMHVCGYLDPLMEDMMDLGLGAISLDGPSSLARMVEVSQKRVAIIGNVPTTLFEEGSKEEIEQAVRHCLEIAADGSGYILSSGCEIPINSPRDKVDYYFQAALKYGRYQ